MATHVLTHWDPEDAAFWESEGRAVATRNLWSSIPSLTLAFAVWMVWSVVVVHLPDVGFSFSTNELFWLAALPSLCGATLMILYSFMAPIFGGRRWTAISTASLLLEIPNLYRRQVPFDRYHPHRCRWRFGSNECGYVINAVAGFTTCTKDIAACVLRGDDMVSRNLPRLQPARFGAWPGIPLA